MTSTALPGVLARAIPVLFVLCTTLVAFRSGVEVSERPGLPASSLIVQLYYAIGLFVLGGLDLGTPTGGPPGARQALWGAYFLGPAITTSAVIESAIRMTQPAWAQRLWNRDHVVILGNAPVARFYAAAVASSDPKRRIRQLAADERHDPRHALERARRVVVATDDDLANLGIAWEILQRMPGVPIDVHVGQLGLRGSAMALTSHPRVRIFNAYAITADAVYASVLAPHLAATTGSDVVAILGFGRFGQTVLRRLHENAQDEVASILVVDRGADRKVRQFEEQSRVVERVPMDALDGDLRDPAVWDAVAERLTDAPVQPIVLVATDDDTTNLQAAVGLRGRLPEARVFVRWASETPFLRAVEAQHRVEGLAVEDALREALINHYHGSTC